MRINLSLQQLEAFLDVTSTCSFRASATRLGISQPALSRRIRQAEQALGARLLDRNTRRVSISAAGIELIPIARRIIHEFDSSMGELNEFIHGRSGQVVIAALPSAGSALVPRVLAQFGHKRPQIHFSLIEAQAEAVLSLVEERRADFGIGVRPDPQRRLRYFHLRDDPFVLVCRRDDPLAAYKVLPWSVFTSHPCVVSHLHTSIRPITDAVFLRQRAQPHVVMEYPSVGVAGALVAAGVGITALPVLALQLINMAGLVAVPLRRPFMSRPIGIMTRVGQQLSPGAHEFIDDLQTWSKAAVFPVA